MNDLEILRSRSYFVYLKHICFQSEYAAAFADSQAMGVQNRAHIEELQRYCRERDYLVNDLEMKIKVKLYLFIAYIFFRVNMQQRLPTRNLWGSRTERTLRNFSGTAENGMTL